jgi:hypothetical protein
MDGSGKNIQPALNDFLRDSNDLPVAHGAPLPLTDEEKSNQSQQNRNRLSRATAKIPDVATSRRQTGQRIRLKRRKMAHPRSLKYARLRATATEMRGFAPQRLNVSRFENVWLGREDTDHTAPLR